MIVPERCNNATAAAAALAPKQPSRRGSGADALSLLLPTYW